MLKFCFNTSLILPLIEHSNRGISRSTSRSQPRAAGAECPLDGHRQMHVRICGHTDTDTRTLQHVRLPGCREQLSAKQHLKQGATSQYLQGHHLPGTRTGRRTLSVTSLLWGELQTRQHLELPSRALLPSQYPVSPDNYTSPFLSPPSPIQDLMTVVEIKTSSGKTVMSSSFYQTGPVALAGFNLKI